MEYEKTIKDAERLARILIQKKARKNVGIYYFMWGFFSLYTILVSTILNYLNVTNIIISSLPYFAVAIPLYYTFKLIKDINWEYIVLKYRINNYLEEAKKQFNIKFTKYVILPTLIVILVFLIIIPNITTNEIIALGSVYIFVGSVIYGLYLMLYSKHRLVGPRYYDLLAMISFIFSGPAFAGLTSPVMSSLISMLIAIVWLYAGFRSILEVSEIE